MLQAKMFHKIKFSKFSENKLWIFVFKGIIAQYLHTDRQDLERHIQFKVSINFQMELFQIKALIIKNMIKEGYFQGNSSICLQKSEG
jgi:hypothetical protein